MARNAVTFTVAFAVAVLFHLVVQCPATKVAPAPAPSSDVTAAASPSDDGSPPIPSKKDQIESWFTANVKPLESRKGTLDPALVAAEADVKRIRVSKDGKGDFKTITDAVKSIPAKNTKRYIISIAGGNYTEKVMVNWNQPFVTLIGDPKDRPTIIAGETAAKVGTIYSATLYVLSDYFTAININVMNSAPRPDGLKTGQQAVALTITGDKAAFYNCNFYGFQDTLCDHHNKHFYKDCYIEGTVDFIFGDGKSIFLNNEIHVIEGNRMAMVTAHGRKSENEDTGFSFVHCKVTGTGQTAVLGRGWFDYSKVVFTYTDVSDAIKPEGWMGLRSDPTKGGTIFFGEHQNTGAGASKATRPSYVKHLTEAEVKPFLSLGYIQASKWLLPPIKP
ncbi:unnamed protein product [Cuscuta campestris]|uniref:Pectinesterase n=1 Tax=Cuscuta campestris TaxID=132261 RepID=A0A484NK59_9ASTE|nr:unnamed protein product [Cuscuta campestris]